MPYDQQGNWITRYDWEQRYGQAFRDPAQVQMWTYDPATGWQPPRSSVVPPPGRFTGTSDRVSAYDTTGQPGSGIFVPNPDGSYTPYNPNQPAGPTVPPVSSIPGVGVGTPHPGVPSGSGAPGGYNRGGVAQQPWEAPSVTAGIYAGTQRDIAAIQARVAELESARLAARDRGDLELAERIRQDQARLQQQAQELTRYQTDTQAGVANRGIDAQLAIEDQRNALQREVFAGQMTQAEADRQFNQWLAQNQLGLQAAGQQNQYNAAIYGTQGQNYQAGLGYNASLAGTQAGLEVGNRNVDRDLYAAGLQGASDFNAAQNARYGTDVAREQGLTGTLANREAALTTAYGGRYATDAGLRANYMNARAQALQSAAQLAVNPSEWLAMETLANGGNPAAAPSTRSYFGVNAGGPGVTGLLDTVTGGLDTLPQLQGAGYSPVNPQVDYGVERSQRPTIVDPLGRVASPGYSGFSTGTRQTSLPASLSPYEPAAPSATGFTPVPYPTGGASGGSSLTPLPPSAGPSGPGGTARPGGEPRYTTMPVRGGGSWGGGYQTGSPPPVPGSATGGGPTPPAPPPPRPPDEDTGGNPTGPQPWEGNPYPLPGQGQQYPYPGYGGTMSGVPWPGEITRHDAGDENLGEQPPLSLAEQEALVRAGGGTPAAPGATGLGPSYRAPSTGPAIGPAWTTGTGTVGSTGTTSVPGSASVPPPSAGPSYAARYVAQSTGTASVPPPTVRPAVPQSATASVPPPAPSGVNYVPRNVTALTTGSRLGQNGGVLAPTYSAQGLQHATPLDKQMTDAYIQRVHGVRPQDAYAQAQNQASAFGGQGGQVRARVA